MPIPGTVVYHLKKRFKETHLHLVEFVPRTPEETLVQVVRIQALEAPPEAKLVEIEVEAFGDNLALELAKKGGRIDIDVGPETAERPEITTGKNQSLADGLLYTLWWPTAPSARANEDINAHITLDLGATYWVDSLRLISSLIRGAAFHFKYYELLVSDGGLAPDGT
ncbi:MAG: hypothetical protein EXS58_17205, partial [Candidatus Latescibacteria bacterium]|nr:hypothetical protein [Candidatus Latescibacterota bacterium]